MAWPEIDQDPWGEQFLAQAAAVEAKADAAQDTADQATTDIQTVSSVASEGLSKANQLGEDLNALGAKSLGFKADDTPTVIGTAATLIPGCLIYVPPTDREVWIHYGVTVGVTTQGAGLITVRVYELTTGAVQAGEYAFRINATDPVSTKNHVGSSEFRASNNAALKPTFRKFALYAIRLNDSGSSLAAYTLDASQLAWRSWISSEVR